MRFCRKYLLFICIPAIVGIAIIPLKKIHGRYYFNVNADPAYLYLINGLNIANLEPVAHVDNPGSTVQVLAGAVIRLTALLKGADNITDDVLLNPECYLEAINNVMLAANLIALVLLGGIAYRVTGNIFFSLIIQSSPFASWQLFKALLNVSPEPLSFFASIVWIVTLLVIIKRDDLKKQSRIYASVLAVLTAFGVATKLTYVPFIIIPLIILYGWRWKLAYLFLSLILFHLFIFPAWGHYDYFIAWLKSLIIYSDTYGTGSPVIVEWQSFFINLLKLIINEHVYYATIAISSIQILYCFINRKRLLQAFYSVEFRLLLGIVLAAVFQLLLVAKHYAPHYLVPALLLWSFIIFLNLKVFQRIKEAGWSAPGFTSRLIQFGIIAISCLLYIRHFLHYLLGSSVSDWLSITMLKNLPWLAGLIGTYYLCYYLIKKHGTAYLTKLFVLSWLICLLGIYQIRNLGFYGFYDRMDRLNIEAHKVMSLAETQYEEYAKIYGGKSTSQVYALWSGAYFIFPQEAVLNRIRQLHNDEKIYFWLADDERLVINNWTGDISFAEVMETHSKILIFGDVYNLTPERISHFEASFNVKLEPVFMGFELVYKILPATGNL